GPAAQKTAAETGVDLSRVQGTGRGGGISKPDVLEAAARAQRSAAASASAPPSVAPAQATAPAPRPAPPASDGKRETREKMSTRRKRIAEHLLESQHATAHLTTFNEIDMTAVS